MANLPASPVQQAFAGIQWDPMQKLRLSSSEKSLLRSAEANPIDYTLNNVEESTAYVKVVLKVLAESASGASGPSSRVSHLREEVGVEEALQLLYLDPMGVVTHYAIGKLCDCICCLKEKRRGSDVSLAGTFYDRRSGQLMDEWRVLLRVLHLGGGGDAYAQRGAAFCLGHILMVGCPSQRSLYAPIPKSSKSSKSTPQARATIDYATVEEPLQALISWITSQLQSSASSSLSLVTPTLTSLLACPEARVAFAQSGGIGYLSRHLRSSRSRKAASSQNVYSNNSRGGGGKNGATVQQLYELCFCLWTLTYECETSSSIRATFARDNAVPSLVELVSSAPREKVVRVALAALRTLAQCGDSDVHDAVAVGKNVTGATFVKDMIGCGLIKTVDLMKERQWTDPDIVDDLDVLHKLLHDNYREMSRWDIYLAEVESGRLEWNILHTEKFFKENAKRFEGKNSDFAVVKTLIALTASHDEEVQAIACFDIGEFVRHYPNGRAIARSLGAKNIVMKLVDHKNEELQRHALTAVSKMLVQNWASVQ